MISLNKFMKMRKVNILTEAYTKVDEIANEIPHGPDNHRNVYEFLKNIANQIDLYRSAIINERVEE